MVRRFGCLRSLSHDTSRAQRSDNRHDWGRAGGAGGLCADPRYVPETALSGLVAAWKPPYLNRMPSGSCAPPGGSHRWEERPRSQKFDCRHLYSASLVGIEGVDSSLSIRELGCIVPKVRLARSSVASMAVSVPPLGAGHEDVMPWVVLSRMRMWSWGVRLGPRCR